MKALLFAILLWQVVESVEAPAPDQRYFKYRRPITIPVRPSATGSPGQACATLDGEVYAHGAPSLKDLRLYVGAREAPYAVTLSESIESENQSATVLNLGLRGKKISFDLAMPDRPYTDVTLNLDAHNFIAAAEVSGTNHPGETPTRLGTFTLFDLTAQRLSRSTTLHLQESRFSTLHIELSVSSVAGGEANVPGPSMVTGAAVPPSREAQTVYTAVATSGVISQKAHQTIASFRLPAHVPMERVSFALSPIFTGNFSRDVRITAHAEGTAESASETLAGSILRVHLEQAGREIRQQELSVPATLGANLQKNALVEVTVENGDDAPLPISSVSLEMRQRRLCFNQPATNDLALFYGDAVLEAPVYDFARLLSLASAMAPAELGAEHQNPAYIPRPERERSLTERHPELLWIVLLAVVCILAVVATHSAKRMPK
ncbi:DUF3999 domain-containing protein [Granulicella arctica]|uniref:DUF3999 domain-containing protein n=1 Tax=Granulicella arctica TaxID=940613 RepID=UPI0021E0B606|nr:DUF3999 domain-containing protein [Granulicella arctica]